MLLAQRKCACGTKWNPPALISVVWHVLKITAWDHHRDQQGRCPHVIQEICTVPCPLYYPLSCTLSFVHTRYTPGSIKCTQYLLLGPFQDIPNDILLYKYTKAKHATHVHRSAWLLYGIWYCNCMKHRTYMGYLCNGTLLLVCKYHILCHALRTQCKIVWPTLPLILDLNLPEMHPCLLHPESTKHLLSLGFAINASSWQWEMMALSRSRGTSLKKN